MSTIPDQDSENERYRCDKFTRYTWIDMSKIPDRDSENERNQCDKLTRQNWIGMSDFQIVIRYISHNWW